MFLQRKKTIAMKRILTHVGVGYIHYTKGFSKPEKIESLIEKFTEKYHIHLKEHQKYYRKSKGKSNCFFTCYPIDLKGKKMFAWWLLATDGKGRIHEEENLQNAIDKNQLLTWLDEYEIVRLPRIKQMKKDADGVPRPIKKNSNPSFTWRMTNKNYTTWLSRIESAVKAKEDNSMIKQAIWSLKRVPGFRGNREQVKKLFKVLKGYGERYKSKSYLIKPDELKIGYLRNMKNDFVDISTAVENIQKGRRFDRVKNDE